MREGLHKIVSEDETIVAISTPLGRSGIGVVRLSGAAALSIARRFLKTKSPLSHRMAAVGVWMDDQGEEIDEVGQRIYTEVNNGVYRCGFAGSQEAYDKAYDRLFTALDWLEDRLTGQRYLVGDTITEADVRLFTTLARFDPVYHGHFKCNRQKLDEFPALWG